MAAARPPPTVRYHGPGYDEPLELELVTDDGERVTAGLTIAAAETLKHALTVRLLQARNSRQLPDRRLPFAD